MANKKMIWEIRETNKVTVAEILARNGWEPYAVVPFTVLGGTWWQTYHFRRQVEKE